jgi:hypothetical protein
MDSSEAHTHSFIVRIWREETSVEAPYAMWRGHITHVPGSQQHYLRDLDDISTFILPYLEAMRVRLTLRWRVKLWLLHWGPH